MIFYLNTIKKTSISELAERFEVSRRTVMRDLDAISALGVPVYTQPGYCGGVCIDENYKFDKSFFSKRELEELILALHIADGLRRDGSKNSILQKLELLHPELTLAKENDLYEYVKIEPLLSSLALDDPIFLKINQALDDEVWIIIKCGSQLFRIVPLCYMVGAEGMTVCGSDGERRLSFPVDRITECTLTEQEFCREDFRKFYNE